MFSILTSKIFGGLLAVAVLCLPLAYCKGRSDGKAAVYAKLEKAQKVAEEKAEKAAVSADEKQQGKAEAFEVEQDALRKVIDDATAEDVNALDAIL